MRGGALPPEMLIVFCLVAVLGGIILYITANKKWGYTEQRERELEEQPDLQRTEKKKPFVSLRAAVLYKRKR